MKKQLGIAMTLALCLLSSSAALANDAVLGALLGDGAGAVVGHSVGGRDGTIIGGAIGAAAGAAIGSQGGRGGHVEYVGHVAPPPVYYAAPAYQQQAYYPQPQAYYPQQQVYYAQPVRPRPIYYVERGYHRGYQNDRHYDRRDWDRDHRRGRDGRGWDGRR